MGTDQAGREARVLAGSRHVLLVEVGEDQAGVSEGVSDLPLPPPLRSELAEDGDVEDLGIVADQEIGGGEHIEAVLNGPVRLVLALVIVVGPPLAGVRVEGDDGVDERGVFESVGF
jgi:hypothetical protein